MSKQFLGVIVAIILVFVGIFAISSKKSDTTKSSSSGKPALSQHVQLPDAAAAKQANIDPATAPLLVEYGDYQCPYCEQYYPTVKQATDEFKDQIRFQFRNYPLVNAHQNAFAAARAAEAAAKQNKFWEMHDTLYDSQNYQSWVPAKDPTTYFTTYAKQLGLNVTQFNTDFASSEVNDTINADLNEGTKLGVTGTPSFFLDGKQVQIPNSLASFQKILKDAVAKKAKKATTSSSAAAPAASDSMTTTTQQTPATAQ